MKKEPIQRLAKIAMIGIIACGGSLAFAQTVAPAAAPKPAAAVKPVTSSDEEVLVLSPFTVESQKDRGYQATSTLAGTQLRTDLADLGTAISVYTKEFFNDVGGFNNESVLPYALNTEVAGARGNFSGANVNGSEGRVTEQFSRPNENTRIRGLTAADNTRDYFLTDIPWDGYNIARVDLLRGPNAILFGLGSPAGLVNAGTNTANFKNSSSVEAMFDKFGTIRVQLDANHVLIPNELALRVDLVNNEQKFQQKPAFRNDRRVFAAVKYNPSALNKNGSRFEVLANAEMGKINSNNPRYTPPDDQISSFWRPISEGGVNQNTFDVNLPFNPAYENSVVQEFGPGMSLYANAGGIPTYSDFRIYGFGQRNSDGSLIPENQNNSSIGAYPGNQRSDNYALVPFSIFAGRSNLPFAGLGAYRNDTVTDTSVFNFYKKLIDGNNKGETFDWTAFNVSVRNTFLNDSIGYEVSAYKEKSTEDFWSVLGNSGNALRVDLNKNRNNGTANANLGRAYVLGSPDGGILNVTDRTAYRGKIYGTHDFSKKSSAIWAKIVGTQTITGVFSDEEEKHDIRGRRLFNFAPDSTFYDVSPVKIMNQAGGQTLEGIAQARYYLDGPNVIGSTTGTIKNSNFNNVTQSLIDFNGGPTSFYRFDNTWTAANSVSPGAAWINPLNPTGTYTQSNNPANYRGFIAQDATLVTIRSGGNVPGTYLSAQDYLVNRAALNSVRTTSYVGVYQGSFWNNSIIGIYGKRLDRQKTYSYISDVNTGTGNADTGSADLTPGNYNYSNPNAATDFVETKTKNWSVMAHVNKLVPGFDPLPVNLRVYYNKGQNIQPQAGRVDFFNQSIPSPAGDTTDKSIMISTKDDRYSLRVTKFNTKITNESSGQIGGIWAFQQMLGNPGTQVREFLRGNANNDQYGGTPEQYNNLITKYIPAWIQFEKDTRARYPQFIAAWLPSNTIFGTDQLTGNLSDGIQPAGSVLTENKLSTGYEVEFTANPTKNWRIALNASKTESVRSDIPGVEVGEFLAWYDDKIQNTDAGLAPIWWTGNRDGLRNFGPYPFAYRPDYLKALALNGQSAGEVRKYRANLITSYDFTSGALSGYGVGGAYRFEDKSTIGYAPYIDEVGVQKVNVNAPFLAPGSNTVDLWVSYTRKLSNNVKWKIQLNVFNVGGKNELVPIAAGVDPVAIRTIGTITTDTVIPMKATSFTIRQGMSWQIMNRFEF